MPSASAATAARVKPGVRRRERKAYRRSCPSVLSRAPARVRLRSLAAEGQRRVDAGGPSGGQVARERRHEREQQGNAAEGDWVGWGRLVEKARDPPTSDQCGQQPEAD